MSFCFVGECVNPDAKSDISVLYLKKSRGKNQKIWIALKILTWSLKWKNELKTAQI